MGGAKGKRRRKQEVRAESKRVKSRDHRGGAHLNSLKWGRLHMSTESFLQPYKEPVLTTVCAPPAVREWGQHNVGVPTIGKLENF